MDPVQWWGQGTTQDWWGGGGLVPISDFIRLAGMLLLLQCFQMSVSS